MSDKTTLLFVFLFVFVGYIHFIENKLWADVVELVFYIIGVLILVISLTSNTVTAGFVPFVWAVIIAGFWCIYFMSKTIKYRLDRKLYR